MGKVHMFQYTVAMSSLASEGRVRGLNGDKEGGREERER